MCQVHTAMCAVVQSLWLDESPATKLFEHAAEKINWHQHRNATARKGHVKKTRRRLRNRGITLSKIKRCQWPKRQN